MASCEQQIEKFIKYILEKNAVEDNKISRRVLCDFYTNFIADKSTLTSKNAIPFKEFLKQMWSMWYVCDVVDGTTVYFNSEWIEYLQLKPKLFCAICQKIYRSQKDFENHSAGIEHLLRIKYKNEKNTAFNTNSDLEIELVNTNNNVIGNAIKDNIKTNITLSMKILNNTERIYKVKNIVRVMEIEEIQLIEGSSTIQNGKPLTILLKGFFKNSCTFIYPLIIVLANEDSIESYLLVEMSFEIVSDYSDFNNSHHMQTPRRLPNGKTFDIESKILTKSGDRPQNNLSKPGKILLLSSSIPENLNSQLSRIITQLDLNSEGTLREIGKTLNLSTTLTTANYSEIMSKLLHIEEHQLVFDLREYDNISDLEKIHLDSKSSLYKLKVAGLAEARPSLLVGDKVNVFSLSKFDRHKYVGFIHNISQDSVNIHLHKKFSNTHFNDLEYFIQFNINRYPMMVAHQAIKLSQRHHILPYFFPKINKIDTTEKATTHSSITLFNNNLNEEQKLAVIKMIQIRDHPYLLFGPPGTGKTLTLVEGILQVWKLYKNQKILVCAPSNAAVNEILVRLLANEQVKDQVYRLYSASAVNNNSGPFEGYSCNVKYGSMYKPSKTELEPFRIILTTLIKSAYFYNHLAVGKGYFSYVFIDESGYACECDALIPVAGILSHKPKDKRHLGHIDGQLVLAGDPKQLGPIIQSPIAKYFGLGKSMMERLMEADIYMQPNPEYFVKLLNNYRSNEHILHIPNKLFYRGELIAMADANSRSSLLCEWEHLPKKHFPLLFHHINGVTLQDSDSPSFYNIQEIEVVTEYLNKLLGYKLNNGKVISEEDIGIISPYKKQVAKLKRACKRNKWSSIAVNSVEQFQGKEKLIIIVSTVRSKCNKNFENIMNKIKIGFLNNQKRFNVTITRAQALCIVIGNGKALYTDRIWRELIDYCTENDSVLPKGVNFQIEDSTNLCYSIQEDADCYLSKDC